MKTFFNYGCGITLAFSFGVCIVALIFAFQEVTSTTERPSTAITSTSDVTSSPEPSHIEPAPRPRHKKKAPPKPVADLSECNMTRDFVLQDAHWERDGPLRYIVGRAVNLNPQREYTFVTVRCDLYNVEGDKMGEANDVVTSIPAGGSWKFKCMVGDPEATKYKGIFLTGN